MRQLLVSLTPEGLQTSCVWACTVTSHLWAPPQGPVHQYNHCPPLSSEIRASMAQAAFSYDHWTLNVLVRHERGKMDKNQPDLSNIHGETQKLHAIGERQDCNTDAVMKLHSWWHSLSLIFDAKKTHCQENKKQRWPELVKSYFPSYFARAKRTICFHSWCNPMNWKDNRLYRIQCHFQQGKGIQIYLHCS